MINTLMLVNELFYGKPKKAKSQTNEFKDCVVPVPRPLKSRTPVAEDGQWYDGRNQFHSDDQDPWTGPQSSADEWYNGHDEMHSANDTLTIPPKNSDQWHSVSEDFATTNIVTHESADYGHIVTARELIGRSLADPKNEKHRYFEFLKYLRNKAGKEYSTLVHQHAAKLAKASKDL